MVIESTSVSTLDYHYGQECGCGSSKDDPQAKGEEVILGLSSEGIGLAEPHEASVLPVNSRCGRGGIQVHTQKLEAFRLSVKNKWTSTF